MKFTFTFIFLIWFLVLDCNKTNYGKVYQGTVIGFDPCTGPYADNSKKGYVIKIDSISEAGTVITLDTVTTYNLPMIFEFTPNLFSDYINSYLFPVPYRDSFKFKFSYRTTPEYDKIPILCNAYIFTGSFYGATKNRQIIIAKVY